MSPFNVEDVVTVGVELNLLKVKVDEGVMAVLTVPLMVTDEGVTETSSGVT